MTPKLLAKPDVVHHYYKCCATLTTQCGRKFTWGHYRPQDLNSIRVGDKVWIAKRINVPTSDWCLDVFEVTITEDARSAQRGCKGVPKTWFGNGRSIIFEISK